MNLPVILDVTIVLVVTYLILSLLAAEIQEVIATIFQWRAKHLKEAIENLLGSSSSENSEHSSEKIHLNHEEKASGIATTFQWLIEVFKDVIKWIISHLKEAIEEIAREVKDTIVSLLTGSKREIRQKRNKNKNDNVRRNDSSGRVEQLQVRNLVDELYNDPLIKNVNQEAKGTVENLLRCPTWWFAERIFGDNKHSGPSYLNKETFATTLLETLKISTLSQNESIIRLKNFNSQQLVEIEERLKEKAYPYVTSNIQESLKKELKELENGFAQVVKELESSGVSVDTTVERIGERLKTYIDNSQATLQAEENPPGNSYEKEISEFKKQMEDWMKYSLISPGNSTGKQVLLKRLNPSLTEVATLINKDNTIPQTLRESLAVLAIRAQTRIKREETDLEQLRKEIEVWFERSMDRSIGVYKRNAKLVAFMIGFIIAVTINLDTLNIINQSSQNENQALRDAFSKYAQIQVNLKCQYPQPPDGIAFSSEAEQAKAEQAYIECLRAESTPLPPLPIGWTKDNKQQQGLLYDINADVPQEFLRFLIKVILTLFGWILSALAISMGAPFWFDLLSKVMNVRNTGKRIISTEQLPSDVKEPPQRDNRAS